MMSISTSIEISPAAADDLAAVLALVFAHHEPQDARNRVRATLAEIREGKLPSEGLLIARRGGNLVGAALAHVLPGRSATFWPPQLVPNEAEETAGRLVAAAIEYLRLGGIRVVHSILPGEPLERDVARLEQAEFRPLAELYYLMAERHDFPKSPPESPLEFEPYTAAGYERLCGVVEATYEATLDCPGLDNVRQSAEVLEGYGAGGGVCPDGWFIIRHADRDVGCLLLGDYPEHDNCELTYMGLVPAVRGNDWGLAVTRHAQWVARSLGRERVVLAVDSRNIPARNMYAAAGFRGWDRRQVLIRVLHY